MPVKSGRMGGIMRRRIGIGIVKKAGKRNDIAGCLLAVLTACLLTACSASVGQTENTAAMDAGAWESKGDVPVEEVAEYEAADTAMAGAEGMEAANSMQVQENVTDRKLIREVSMEVETEQYDGLIQTVEEQVAALGGYIESSYASGGGRNGGTRYVEISARIPKEKMDAFITAVEGVSSVRNKRETVEDVTLQYVDLESHKKALQTEQNRLLELLGQAESVEDIITIESRLSEVRYQLESMESQLRTFDNKIDYSTIYLSVSEVLRLTPADGEKLSVWERMRTGFSENLYRLGIDLQDMAVGFVVNLPYLTVWLIVILVVLGIVLLFRKQNRRKRQEKTGNAHENDKRQDIRQVTDLIGDGKAVTEAAQGLQKDRENKDNGK